jgi:predicted Na+-dependent transporter
MSLGVVARLVLLTVLVPLVAGMAIRSLAATFAARIARTVSVVATVLLVVRCL